MSNTAHIKNDGVPIAQTILLPGDPLRAKFIADHYLEKPARFNQVRNMLGFTGLYRGVPVSVMGTGMGIPSMGIYSHELIHNFGVKRLIRIGTCGGVQEGLHLRDVVLAMGVSTNSAYAHQFKVPGTLAALASWPLLSAAAASAARLGMEVRVGNVLCSDVFYNADREAIDRWREVGVLAVEMESYALYLNAALARVQALSILTVSDLVSTGEETSPEERETSFRGMAELALDLAHR